MQLSKIVCRALAALVLLWCGQAGADMRPVVEDAELVRDADLIVVGRLAPQSLRLVKAKGRQPEHHRARLEIVRVLKGAHAAQGAHATQNAIAAHSSVELEIDSGLTPLVGGKGLGSSTFVRGQSSKPGVVEIIDTGASALSLMPLVPDAASPNVWLLRRPRHAPPNAPARFRLHHPSELQPLAHEPYLQAYLAPRPLRALARFFRQPRFKERIRRYHAHRTLQKLLQQPDRARRARGLARLYQQGMLWRGRVEARRALIDMGRDGGTALQRLYASARKPERRADIMRLWSEVAFAPAEPLALAELQRQHRFWRAQEQKGGLLSGPRGRDWWNAEHPLTQTRRQQYGLVFSAVLLLERAGSKRAVVRLERTRQQWQRIHPGNPQIVEACDRALARLH